MCHARYMGESCLGSYTRLHCLWDMCLFVPHTSFCVDVVLCDSVGLGLAVGVLPRLGLWVSISLVSDDVVQCIAQQP